MHIRCGIPSVGEQNDGLFVGDDGLVATRSRSGSDDHSGRYSLPSRRFATSASRTPSADGISRNPFERGNDQLFSLPKRKKLAKKKLATLQVDRLCAHQLSRKNIFCFQRCCASDGGFTYTRNQEVGICRFTNGRFRFDGRGACPSSSREPRNTNRMGLRSTIRGDRDQMDAEVRRRGSTAPTRGFVPAVCG